MELSALYLPQFHEIPENNEWWGPGFTEWTNVKRARPLFRGHHQPVVPGELGYYNLLDPEVRERQAELARGAGITSFCYWHYWFAGRELLERPFDEVLAGRSPDFPFFLGWANQSWSGVWHGAPERILMSQTYPDGDDQAHFTRLLPAFRDERYVRLGGRPVLLVFNPTDLPHPAAFVERWQTMAASAGLGGLYLVAWIEGKDWGVNYSRHDADGFDAGLYVHFPFARDTVTRVRDRLRSHHERFGPGRYEFCRDLPRATQPLRGTVHASVQPNWDNTPRSQRRGAVALGSSPDRFQRHLAQALAIEDRRPTGEKLCVIKSWNEWAEGNYVEPDQRFGRGWLDAVRRALDERGTP